MVTQLWVYEECYAKIQGTLRARTCKATIYLTLCSANEKGIAETIETLSNYFKVLPTGIAQTKE